MVRDRPRRALTRRRHGPSQRVGTSNYPSFWGMGGETQEFADMDSVNPADCADPVMPPCIYSYPRLEETSPS